MLNTRFRGSTPAAQTGAVVTRPAVRKHYLPQRTRGSTICLTPGGSTICLNPVLMVPSSARPTSMHFATIAHLSFLHSFHLLPSLSSPPSSFLHSYLLPGPSSSPRRKHFLPLRLHFHIVKSTSCLLSCCPMAVLRAPSRVACMAPIQFH